jgi:feruloyl esterase
MGAHEAALCLFSQGGVVMTGFTRALLCGVAGLALTVLSASNSPAQTGFAIRSTDTAIAGATTADSVQITVTGPSTPLLLRSTLLLNGKNVTWALQPDGTGSMSGTVSGLVVGSNTLKLYALKGQLTPVATLIVERATTPQGLVPVSSLCSGLARLTGFPVQPVGNVAGTIITSAVLTAATQTLPEHCLVRGSTQQRIGTDGVQYANLFEVRLPSAWNGRFLFTGGGGTEGSVPAATGGLAQGFATATQDGGHENSVLTAAGKSTLDFFLEPSAFQAHADTSIDKTYQTAQYLITQYYGRGPDRNYFNGCSTGGRQGMTFAQRFPTYFNGIIAGDPVYNLPALTQGETNALQAMASVDTVVAAGPGPNGLPRYNLSFTQADENLFTNAILAACDALDGLVDGVIDNLGACNFDPETFVWPAAGPYGTIAPLQPLQCGATKTATCLTASQIAAIKRTQRGPRTSQGNQVFTTQNLLVEGYPFDGGWMEPNSGIPTRDIGTSTTQPGNLGLGSNQIGYYLNPPDPSFIAATQFNFDTDPQREIANNPIVAANPDISTYKDGGGKLIFYHGLSDPGPSNLYTLDYYNALAALNGGINAVQSFARYFRIPNMGHCSGGPATSTFDGVTSMVNWVENGVAPDSIPASGTAFRSTQGTTTGLPTTRSRPLCPYPQAAKYVGPAGGNIADFNNYACVLY